MAYYSVAGRTSGAGTTARPAVSLYAIAGVGCAIREIGFWNTTANPCVYKVARLSTTGTQGTPLTEVEYNESAPAPSCTAFDTHSADATVGGAVRQMQMGAAIGSGVIFPFGGEGLIVQPGTGNGVGVVLATGTGQILDYYIAWEE